MLNIEIKARTSDPDRIRNILKSKGARFTGIDMQKDTYFDVQTGRLKLREGNIENNLIWYNREDRPGPKRSEVILYRSADPETLKDILSGSMGVKMVVEKKREIYFIDNIKFHIDVVDGLGSFVEIEAIDKEGTLGHEKLKEQCNTYIKMFDIREEDLVSGSYSDILAGA